MSLEPTNTNHHDPLRHSGTISSPSLSLIHPEVFSARIHSCRERFLSEDGRFTPEQIVNISGSGDGFDEGSFHLVSGSAGQETGIMRVTIISRLGDSAPKLPFQHFYPGYTQPLQPGDAEISRFLVGPSSRKGKSTSFLIEAAFRLCAQENAERLFIDVVDGDLGVAPKSYERHFGFKFTGVTGYDDNYSCLTHLMVLEGAEKIREIGERLTARIARLVD